MGKVNQISPYPFRYYTGRSDLRFRPPENTISLPISIPPINSPPNWSMELKLRVNVGVPEKSPVDVVGVKEGEIDGGDIDELC